MTRNTWYVKKDGKELGPFSSADLKRMVAQSEILKSDSVRRSDLYRWISAGKIKKLFRVTESPVGETAMASASRNRADLRGDRDGAIHESTEVFYRQTGRRVGPLTFTVLKQLAGAGLLKAGDEVRIGRDGEWIEAARVPGLLPPEAMPIGSGAITTFSRGSIPPPPPLPPTDERVTPPPADVTPSRERQLTAPPPIPAGRDSSPEAPVPTGIESRKGHPVSLPQDVDMNKAQTTTTWEGARENTSRASQNDNASSWLGSLIILLITIVAGIVGLLLLRVLSIYLIRLPYRMWESVSPNSYNDFSQPLLAIIVVTAVGFTVVHLIMRWIRNIRHPQMNADDFKRPQDQIPSQDGRPR